LEKSKIKSETIWIINIYSGFDFYDNEEFAANNLIHAQFFVQRNGWHSSLYGLRQVIYHFIPMAYPKQIIRDVYSVFADNNLSRILPVLDEKIVLYISGYGPTGREYQGRSGFLTMMSELYTICENLRVDSLVYFTPDDDQQQELIITTGFFEGILIIDNELATLPFVHTWQVKAEKVVELRAFYWDFAKLLYRLQPGVKRPDFPSNGQYFAGNDPDKT
jgi:hypothetical protein